MRIRARGAGTVPRHAANTGPIGVRARRRVIMDDIVEDQRMRAVVATDPGAFAG